MTKKELEIDCWDAPITPSFPEFIQWLTAQALELEVPLDAITVEWYSGDHDEGSKIFLSWKVKA